MTAPVSAPSMKYFDPMVSLATSVHAQDGVYALLLGSGVSTGAGVPTGWGVVTDLARRAATAAGAVPDGDFEAEAWWAEHGGDVPLGYSVLLEALAKTPAARRALLAAFFEPTEEDREDGRKVPSTAHKAIAELVRRGSIRVIVTTNFDRLLEQALEAIGIMPQVVATPSAVAGMEPLAHARCTVIKLHGDYASLDQLNTLEELTAYSPEMAGLLDRVLDEYGLVVSGWSADWDHALVAALERARSRRYPLYWASYRDLGAAASRLVALHRASVVAEVAADRFFPDLVSRLEALDSLGAAPLSVAMSIAQLKRALPDPVKHIQVADLFDEHVAPIRDLLGRRATFATSTEPEAVEEEHEVLVRSANALLQLIATGVYLDRDEQHTSLWVHVIQRLMRARHAPSGTHHQWVDALAHLPALLVLRAAVIAAIEAGHERAVVRMLNEPSWRDPFGSREGAPAAVALHDYRVLDHDIINTFPRWNGTRWLYARSRYIKDALRPILVPLLGDEETYIRAFNRAEYRTALAQQLSTSHATYRAAPGEFIGEGQWNREDGLTWEADFRSSVDREAWGWKPVEHGAADPFDDAITSLTEALKHSRRWG